MSIVLDILEYLWSTSVRYKGVRVNLFGFPKQYKPSSVKNTLSRLHKKELIENKNGKWYITKEGTKFFEKSRLRLKDFDIKFEKNFPKNLLLMFDIPESRKSERVWFRNHLKRSDYIMLQKSVWVGPSPLPKEFMDYVKEIKLSKSILTFKLAKPYKIK